MALILKKEMIDTGEWLKLKILQQRTYWYSKKRILDTNVVTNGSMGFEECDF